MGAISSLNLANNNLGELVPPVGWNAVGKYADGSGTKYVHIDGSEQDDPPAGSKREGIIAIANAIPDMGAISIVNLGENKIQFSNELCMTLLRCAIDSRCGLRIQVEGNDFSAVKHTMEFVLLEMFGKEDIPTEVNVESAGLTGIITAQ
jgi:hypothetical protein